MQRSFVDGQRQTFNMQSSSRPTPSVTHVSFNTAFTIDAARNIRFTTAIIRAQLVQQPSNPLIATLKPQSNGPSYSNTTIGTLAVDEWDVTFGTARRGLGGAAARPGPFSLYQM